MPCLEILKKSMQNFKKFMNIYAIDKLTFQKKGKKGYFSDKGI